MQQFYYEIEVIDDTEDIKISCFRLLFNGSEYMKQTINISRCSIMTLVEVLLSGYISKRQETVIKTRYDYIELYYGGTDDNPIIQLYNRRKVITGINTDHSGPIAIPLDVWGTNDYLFIEPLIEDLKKYYRCN